MPPAMWPCVSSATVGSSLAGRSSSAVAGSWPRWRQTSSTSAWLTRVDLPDPETPVTAVITPSGKRDVERAQVVARDAAQLEPALRLAWRRASRLGRREQVARGVRAGHLRQAVGRAAVEDAPAFFAGVGSDVDDPVGAPHRRQVVLDDEDRVAGALEVVERGEQRAAVLRVQSRGRLVEHVDDAEQVRADLRRQAQPLQLSRRERRRAAREREIAEPERLERADALDQIAGDALATIRFSSDRFGVRRMSGAPACAEPPAATRRAVSSRAAARVRAASARARRVFVEVAALSSKRPAAAGASTFATWLSGSCASVPMSTPAKVTESASALQPLAVADRADRAGQVARDALLHQRALRRRERVQHVIARTGEGAHVGRLGLAAQGRARLCRREAGIDRHRRLLVGEEDPVARLLRQIAPRRVDVDAERDQDVAQVLAVPRRRPGGDRAIADRQRVVGDHRLLGHLVDAAEAVAVRARALRRVGREVLGVEHRLARRIRAGARIQQAHEARQRRHAADRRARAGRAALLLQRDRGRQSFDRVDVGNADLVDQAARVRRRPIRSSGAAPRRRACRRRATTCPIPRRP